MSTQFEEAGPINGVRILLMDSISSLEQSHAGAVAVSGSHGGRSSGRIAAAVRLRAAFFNDAGVGKEQAGLAGLAILDEVGVVAGTVAHTSARIGDAHDTWASGVVTHVNKLGLDCGLTVGAPLKAAVRAMLANSS